MSPIAARILQAVTAELAEHNLEACAGGTVSLVVKLDAAGCPRRVAVHTEVEREVIRKRPCMQVAGSVIPSM